MSIRQFQWDGQNWFCIMFAAVVQKQIDPQQYVTHAEGQQILGRQPRQTKLGKLPRIIGLPVSVVESSGVGCGNRTGEECFAFADENVLLFFLTALLCACSSNEATALKYGVRSFI